MKTMTLTVVLLTLTFGVNLLEPQGEEQCQVQTEETTEDLLRERLKNARRFVPDGEVETIYFSESHKTSSQRFPVLDGRGKWFTVTTTCEGQCTSWSSEVCGVSGCDVSGRTCTQLICTGSDCRSRCSKISIQ